MMSNMEKSSRVPRTIRNAVCVICFILTAVLTVTSFIIGEIKNTVQNDDFFERTVGNGAYASDLKGRIDASLEADCRIYGVPYDVLRGVISEDELSSMAVRHTKALFRGESTEDVRYPGDDIAKAAEAYGKGEGSESVCASEENVILLTEKITGRIGSTFDSVGKQPLVGRAASALTKNATVGRLCGAFPYILCSVLLALVLTAVTKHGNIPSKLYAASGALFIGTSFCFVPVLLLKLSGLNSEIAIGDSYLRQFFLALTDGLIADLYRTSLIMFSVSAALLVLSAVLKSAGRKKE